MNKYQKVEIRKGLENIEVIKAENFAAHEMLY